MSNENEKKGVQIEDSSRPPGRVSDGRRRLTPAPAARMAVTTIGGQDGGAFPQVSGAEAAARMSCADEDASDDARGMT